MVREIIINTETNAAIESYERTNEIFSNILFKNCNLGFITGGYAGRFDNIHGVTRTGYELAKKYEKPIISIMCNAGRFDKNQFTDVDVFFGMHWGDDTKALSSFSDAAVMIAPFGAWSNIELFYLSYKRKPTVIYLSKIYVEKFIELINKEIYKEIILTRQITLYELFMGNKDFSDEFIKNLNLKDSDKFGISTLLKNITIVTIEENLNLVDLLAKEYSDTNNIKDLFTLWFPHYIRDKSIKNAIPVFIEYISLSNYITNSLTSEQISNKIQSLEQYMVNVPELKEFITGTQFELSLNRDLENPFNILTGTYSPTTIKKEPIKYTFTNQSNLVTRKKNDDQKFDQFLDTYWR